MSGKRFEFREATITGMMLPYVYDKVGQEYLNPLKCVDLLNELATKCSQLKKENEQLKTELNAFKPVVFQDMQKGTIIVYLKEEVKE